MLIDLIVKDLMLVPKNKNSSFSIYLFFLTKIFVVVISSSAAVFFFSFIVFLFGKEHRIISRDIPFDKHLASRQEVHA
jgi:hypothetical protein